MAHSPRTRFKKEIISEFLVPKKPSKKVAVFLAGMPTYPGKRRYFELAEYFNKRGYWCFIPRYRGSWESEGQLFLQSSHLDILDLIEELPKGFSNIETGKKYKIKNPEVYLFGSSFGGPAGLLCSKNKYVKKVIVNSPVIDWREGERYCRTNSFNGRIRQRSFRSRLQELQKVDGKKLKVGKYTILLQN